MRRWFALGILSILAAISALATPLGIQGRLLGPTGLPLTDAKYTLTIRIFAAETGGTSLFEATATDVDLVGGLFKLAAAPSSLIFATNPDTWLELQVQGTAALPRTHLDAVPYAAHADVADALACTGCVQKAMLDPGVLNGVAMTANLSNYEKVADLVELLTDYVKKSDLQKVAFTGAYQDLTGLPALSIYAQMANLAAVATSGSYTSLKDQPNLALFALFAELANVATTGSYLDLKDAPVLAKVATTGQYADLLGLPSANAGLPSDGLGTVSNGLLNDVYTASYAVTTVTPIPDNNPDGVLIPVIVPDVGLVKSVSVTVDLTGSKDIVDKRLSLIDPNGVEFVLYNKSLTGTTLKTSFPSPTALASGDLTTWAGKNPQGIWTLKVVDGVHLNNTFDGQVNSWKLDLQVLSSKQVVATGDLVVNGAISSPGTTLTINNSAMILGGQNVARIWSAQNEALADGGYVEVSTGSGDPSLVYQGWVAFEPQWLPSAKDSGLFSGCAICGDGSEGDYVVSPGATASLAGGTHNFRKVTIGEGATVTVTGKVPLILKVATYATIQGAIIASATGSVGVAGGADGGAGGTYVSSQPGKMGSGPGGGAGGSGTGGSAGHANVGSTGGAVPWTYCDSPAGGAGGAAYGSADLQGGLEPGSGGAGAGAFECSCSGCQGGQPGGGGGGAIEIDAGTINIAITGKISVRGADGHSVQFSPDTASGAGSGGTIWLRAQTVVCAGVLDVSGGKSGDGGTAGTGRIRIDGQVTGTTSPPYFAGDTVGLGQVIINNFPITQPTAGTVRMTNNSGATQKVRLVVMH